MKFQPELRKCSEELPHLRQSDFEILLRTFRTYSRVRALTPSNLRGKCDFAGVPEFDDHVLVRESLHRFSCRFFKPIEEKAERWGSRVISRSLSGNQYWEHKDLYCRRAWQTALFFWVRDICRGKTMSRAQSVIMNVWNRLTFTVSFVVKGGRYRFYYCSHTIFRVYSAGRWNNEGINWGHQNRIFFRR